MEKHKYFTAETTAAQPHEDRVCVHFQEAPKRNEETGSTSFSMIWPGLLVAEGVADAEGFAATVTDVLNENAHRFFESARMAAE